MIKWTYKKFAQHYQNKSLGILVFDVTATVATITCIGSGSIIALLIRCLTSLESLTKSFLISSVDFGAASTNLCKPLNTVWMICIIVL